MAASKRCAYSGENLSRVDQLGDRLADKNMRQYRHGPHIKKKGGPRGPPLSRPTPPRGESSILGSAASLGRANTPANACVALTLTRDGVAARTTSAHGGTPRAAGLAETQATPRACPDRAQQHVGAPQDDTRVSHEDRAHSQDVRLLERTARQPPRAGARRHRAWRDPREPGRQLHHQLRPD